MLEKGQLHQRRNLSHTSVAQTSAPSITPSRASGQNKPKDEARDVLYKKRQTEYGAHNMVSDLRPH